MITTGPVPPVRIAFLGGLGEVGRNCAWVEMAGRAILVDCGLMFPGPEMPGVDLVLPDFTYVVENSERLEACVLTHGHEDHCGALAYLLDELSFPIYGSPLTLELAKNRIEEAGLLDHTEFVAVRDGERREIGPFVVEFIPVAHSVPHSHALALHTPQGVILHSGDFKIDLSPVDGRATDLARIGQIAAEEGIRLLLSDSTNAEEQGNSPSERIVGKALGELFSVHAEKRVIAACFASHVHRVQQIADAAIGSGRFVATLGRSMVRNVAVARGLGLLHIPAERLIDIEEAASLEASRVCVVCTGSQGEPTSALALMASGENKHVKVGEGDLVVLSSHAIPGNESDVGKVIDGLCRAGAEVVHSALAPVHASGHAMREELKLLISLANPRAFIPVHGEFRHLLHHSRLAAEMGVPKEGILLAEDGDVVEVSESGVDFAGEVPGGYLYVDGIVGDVGPGVLRDRRLLAEEGVIVVVVTVDARSGRVLTGPEVITRGWVYAPEAEKLLGEAREVVLAAIEEPQDENPLDFETLKRRARVALSRFVQERTRRRPMIVPVVMEV
ncbi:MAG TPA: ribonuclease J [Acidimicrobiales bacterium]|nr:ribonuclease J [Acidimicrobiales bacterium]